MKGKIIALVAVIIIIAGGAYYYFFMMNKTVAPAAQQTGQQTAGTQTPTDPTKVQAQDVKVGTGTEATPGTQVSVLYVGKLSNGTIFDSSAAHGNKPLVFTLGSQSLIPGFQIGVNGMKEGGERLMAIPPALGYGTQDVKDPSGKVVIPANSTILFDVQLVKVQAAPPAATTPAAKTQ